MAVRFHPHALELIQERGATEDEAAETVEYGERFPAKFGRTGFRRNFPFGAEWHGRQAWHQTSGGLCSPRGFRMTCYHGHYSLFLNRTKEVQRL